MHISITESQLLNEEVIHEANVSPIPYLHNIKASRIWRKLTWITTEQGGGMWNSGPTSLKLKCTFTTIRKYLVNTSTCVNRDFNNSYPSFSSYYWSMEIAIHDIFLSDINKFRSNIKEMLVCFEKFKVACWGFVVFALKTHSFVKSHIAYRK